MWNKLMIISPYRIYLLKAQQKKYEQLPPTTQFIITMGYFANRLRAYNYYAFGGGKVCQKAKRRELKETWQVEDEQTLLDQIEILVCQAPHKALDVQLKEEAIAFHKKVSIEEQEQIKALKERVLQRGKGTLGWDLCRAVQLIGWGYEVGELQYEKAYLMSLEICKEIQQSFYSWHHLVDSYLLGYFYETGQAELTVKQIKFFDKGNKNSLFNVSWGTSLSDEIIYEID